MPYGEALLSWTRNGEADLAGYRVYAGLNPAVLTLLEDVGLTATPLTPSANITGFPFFGNLYFAVTAYDTSNNESAFSTAVNKGIAPKLFPLAWG
jgi:hypothetical protein